MVQALVQALAILLRHERARGHDSLLWHQCSTPDRLKPERASRGVGSGLSRPQFERFVLQLKGSRLIGHNARRRPKLLSHRMGCCVCCGDECADVDAAMQSEGSLID